MARNIARRLNAQAARGRAVAQAPALEFKHPAFAAVIEGGRDILQTLLDDDIALGARA